MTEPRRRAPITLRTKLVAISVALGFVVIALISWVSVVTVQRSLESRLDAQLASAFDRAVIVLQAPGFERELDQSIAERRGRELRDDRGPFGQQRGVTDADQILNGPAQAPGTVALVLDDGNLTAGYLSEEGDIEAVTASELEDLAGITPDAKPHTVSLGEDLGRYRVQAALVDNNAVAVGLPLREVQQTVVTLGVTLATLTVFGLILLAVTAALVIRRTMRPLEEVANAADSVAALQLDRGEITEFERIAVAGVDDRTEVGRVVTAVNAMMNNVESALVARESSEQKVRKFVADASHELRTPLASIRGYAELVRRMGGELPDDVERAFHRIESESVRMTALVEDLLLLARLDEGQALTLEPVDVAMIARDSVSDVSLTGPTHIWAILGAEEPLFALADAHRLHQLLVNLLTNARQHTPSGTEVTVSVAREGDEAVIRVADTGPGIPVEAQPTIFSRFVRVDSSRSRSATSKSTGLGLSIVQALTAAHNGSITLTSEPGNTVFELRLPLSVS